MSGFGYNVLGFGANASGGGAVLPSDDQFNRVSFLSHFDGANNGVNNAFDDSSSNNLTISNTGSPTQGSFGPFARPDGEWGVALDGTASFLRATGAGDISGDFTLEAWVFMNSANGNYIHLTYNSGGLINVFNIYNGSAQNFLFGTSSTAGQTTLEFNDTTWDAGVWTHLAVVRSSGTLKIYVNGVADATTSTAVSGNLTDLEYIGTGRGFTSAGQVFDGKVSNVRFSSTARYTSNFTPPTAHFTTDSDTNLLTCQSNRFVDNSSNGYTITPAGSAAVTAFGPFLTSAVYSAGTNGASSQLGATNYVHIADGAWKTLGTGDFTWEYWIYPIGENAYHVGDATAGTNISSTFTLGVSGKRAILYYSIQGGEAYPLQSPDSAPYYNNNEWHHFAYVRSGNDHKLYVNGILRNSETRSGTMVDSTGQFNIGNFGEGYAIGAPDGIYCDVRLVKGTAVYSGSTYTVPTAPLTAISNTELLVNFKDGQAIDSATQNNLTLYGNAKISTGQAKFGDTSMVFDGTGDYVTLPSNSFKPFGTGDFTIECFARFDAINGKGLFQLGASYLPSAVTGPAVFASIATNNPWRIYYGTSEADASVSPSANTWYHVAYVRSSGVTKLYIDGTSIISQNDTTDYTNTFFVIGGGYSSSFLMDGYIDDFRISHMARYTSNFTAPTAAFADKGQ